MTCKEDAFVTQHGEIKPSYKKKPKRSEKASSKKPRNMEKEASMKSKSPEGGFKKRHSSKRDSNF